MDEPSIATSADAETAHKIGPRSARSPRIEVITRGDRRRTWTLDHAPHRLPTARGVQFAIGRSGPSLVA
jgi:hypothetical protein